MAVEGFGNVVWVFVSNTPFNSTDTPTTLQNRAGTASNHQTTFPNPSTAISFTGVSGRYVRVQLTGTNYLSLAEVQVFGAASTLAISGPASLPSGTLNVAYPSTTMTATGGIGAETWTATGLPTGLSINASTGAITGTPATATGSPFSVYITVTDSASPPATVGQTYSLTINAASPSDSNLAVGKTASQSSTLAGSTATAALAVDGNTDGNWAHSSLSHTNQDVNAWWQVDLGAPATVDAIVIWNRTDCCSNRLSDYWVFVSNTPFNSTDTPATLQNRAGTTSSHQTTFPNPSTVIPFGGAQGRYVRVQLTGTNYLSFAEVQVFGTIP